MACTTDPLVSRFAIVAEPDSGNEAELAHIYGTLGAEVLGVDTFFGTSVLDTLLSPSARANALSELQTVSIAPVIDSIEQVKVAWEQEMLIAPFETSPSGLMIDTPDSDVTIRLATEAADASQLEVPLPFETFPSGVPESDDATPIVYTLGIRPMDFVGEGALDSNGEPVVTWDVGPHGAQVSSYPTAQGGIRFTLFLPNEQAASEVYNFELSLPSELELITDDANGTAIIAEVQSQDTEDALRPVIGLVPPSRGVDSFGREIDVQQSFTGSTIGVSVSEPSQLSYPILVDPQLYSAECTSSSRYRPTTEYLRPPKSNRMHCPYWHTFEWANEYWPMTAKVQHGSWRVVDTAKDAECSAPDGSDFDDHGLGWDFQVPCLMHDYCYDLIRVGNPFRYTQVDKDACDVEFRDAMVEHCLGRSDFGTPHCLVLAAAGYAGVSALGDPEAGSRPGAKGWPNWYNQFLRNSQFKQGTRHWYLSGSSASGSVKDGGWFNYVRFGCGGNAGCRLFQQLDLDDYYDEMNGGERLSWGAQVRCPYSSGSCPMRLRLVGRTWLGSEEVFSTYDYSAPTGIAEWWGPADWITLPEGPWFDLRLEIINLSSTRSLDVRFPHLKFR